MSDAAGKPIAEHESQLFRLLAPAEPSRRRLIILGAILIIWIVALIVLYFTTIVPRHPSPPERGLAAASSGELRLPEAR